MAPITQDLKTRFLARVSLGTPDECWEWQGATRPEGWYGAFQLKRGRTVASHRFAFELFFGEIPRGMVVSHSCDNPKCCNPGHLKLRTQAENVADCVAKGRHSTYKLSPGQIEEIKRRYWEERAKQKDLAAEFGVSQGMVSMIVSGKRRPEP
jgi:hypothetical protein